MTGESEFKQAGPRSLGTVHGHLTGHPHIIPAGQEFTVKSILLPPMGEPGVTLVDGNSLLNGPLLALWCSGNGLGNHRGSAFLVAPGVAITALHVIEDYEEHEGLFVSDAELVAFGQQDGVALSWVIRNVVRPEGGDVAILLMDLHTALPDSFALHVFELGARLPRVGEHGTVLGIRTNLPDGKNAIDDSRHHLGKLEAATIASTGIVLDVWPEGRPLFPEPCYALGATAIGCMSGGPVFDARGLVVGMISRSTQSDDGYVTTVALLWQSLWMEIGPTWPPGFLANRFMLRSVMHPDEASFVERTESGLVYVDRPA